MRLTDRLDRSFVGKPARAERSEEAADAPYAVAASTRSARGEGKELFRAVGTDRGL